MSGKTEASLSLDVAPELAASASRWLSGIKEDVNSSLTRASVRKAASV